MAENKKSFLLYTDLIHTVSKMPNDKAGELFKHILRYVNDENPTTDDLIIQLTFEPIKQQLKRDLKKFESTKKERSNSGVLGNLKRWHLDLYEKVVSDEMGLEEAQNIAKHRIATKDIANIAVNDTVTVNVSDNDNDSDNVNVSVIKKETKDKGDLKPSSSKQKSFDYPAFLDLWNNKFNWQIPKIRTVTDKRKKLIQSRIKDYDKTTILEVLKKTEASRFLNGENDRGWTADFDWIFNVTNFQKILEDNYLNKNKQNGKTEGQQLADIIEKNKTNPIAKGFRFK